MIDKPIRVLQMTGSLGYAGIETLIMNVYRNIDRDKIQFDFVVSNDGGRFAEEVRSYGGNIYILPSRSRHPFKYRKALYDLLHSHKEYDIFHCNTNSASAYIDLSSAKRAGVEVRILHSHNASCIVKWQHYLLKPLLKGVYTDKFACSSAAAEWMFGNSDGVEIIKNGVDLTKFGYNADIRKATRDKENAADKFVIGHVGSFQERKNQAFLIDVFNALDIANKELWLIGEGETKSGLEEYAAGLGLGGSVKFMGNRNDVSELMQGMDVFALPSLFEGLAVAAIEAQAAGLKCVIADTITADSMITDNIIRLPLDDIGAWVYEITKSVGYARREVNAQISKSGYDIKDTAERLSKFYIEKSENAKADD